MHLVDLHIGANAARRRVEAPLRYLLKKARRIVRLLKAEKTEHRLQAQRRIDAVEAVYWRARDADQPEHVLYWITLARIASKIE